MTTDLVLQAPLAVTVARGPMVGGSDYRLDYAGQTLADIVADAMARKAVPERFWWHGAVTIDGMPVRPEHWHLVRPHAGRRVHLWIPPQDPVSLSGIGLFLFNAGAPLAVVNAVALGSSTLLAAGIGIVGQLAVNALFTPPQAALSDERGEAAQANRAGIAQNVPRKGQPYPFVFGTARVAPQPLCYARTYLSGEDEYAETVLALAGPHSMTDIRIKGVPVDDDDAIETWVDDGTAEVRTNQFDACAGPTTPINRELPTHDARINEDGYTNLALRDQSTPANSLPGWLRFASLRNADWLDIRLTIRNPIDTSVPTDNQVIWFRLRARKVGESTWKNIGTLPYVARGQGEYRRRIRFHFARYAGDTESAKNPNGFSSPATTLPAVTDDHAVIKNSDGERFPPAYTFRHIRKVEGLDIWPNDDDAETYFTAGVRYEFDLQRSEMVEESELTDIPTMYDGSKYWDYFDARNIGSGIWGIAEDTTDQGDQVILESAISMFEIDIVPAAANFATLHVRVRNKELSEITVLGSSLIPKWNGSVFTGQSATSRPADHFRHLLTDERTVAPIDTAHVDDETLGDWADENDAQSHACNLAYYGGTLGEALRLTAACGYARPLEGLKYSVAFNRDTSGERAVQEFTPRNIRDYSWSTTFSPRPGAVLAKFLNAEKDFEPDELVIEDPYPVPGATGEIEEVEFPGLTTEAEVTARAEFDFLQLRRAIRHRFLCGFEYLSSETRPGNIAMLSHDALHAHAAWGRVASVTDGQNIVVDADIDYSATTGWFSEDDFFSSDDFFAGESWGVAIRSEDTGEVIVVPLEGWTAATRTATVPDTTNVSPGDLCTFGPLHISTRRVLILKVTPQGDDTAEVECQDEGYEWPLGYATAEGALLDSLVLETDGMALSFTTGKALVRDTATPDNAFLGDVNDLLTYASPSAKHVLSADGVLESGTTLRIDHDADGNALGLLVESQRTNLQPYSEDLTQANWSTTRCSVSANAAAAPDGNTTADKLVLDATAATSHFITDTISVANATVHAISVFAKAAELDHIGVYAGGSIGSKFDLSNGTVVANAGGAVGSIAAYPDGWYRCVVIFTSATTAYNFNLFLLGDGGATALDGDGTSGVYLWGYQLEEGAFASSYIATSGSSATRVADDISLATSAFPWSATAGSLVAHAAPSIAGVYLPAVISDGTFNEQIQLRAGADNHLRVVDGGAEQAALDAGGFSDGVYSKLAAAWAADDFAASIDGGTVATDSSGSLPTVDTLQVGAGSTVATGFLDGHLKSLVYRPRRATDAELVAETD